MKTNKYNRYISAALISLVLAGTTSCVSDLNTSPLSPSEKTSGNVFGNEEGAYISSLAKIYAGMAIGGNQGGDAEQDVAGIDGGSQASFLRVLWNMQELPTDMAHCAWSDPGIPGFNMISWGADSPWIKGSYYRMYYQVNLANAFLRETTEEKLLERACSSELIAKINAYRAEARFLRALNYTYLLDLYRNVPLVTEQSPIGEKVLPEQATPQALFGFIETELLAVEGNIRNASVGYSQEYGHATKAAVWALLSRLYLNAEVYTGQAKYTESITYSKKVIGAGFNLESNYADMFKADNHLSEEMIFPVRYEGDQTMTWGGMTAFLCWGSADLKDDVNAKDAWQGVRAKSSLLRLFEKESSSGDDTRKTMLHTDLTKNIEIVDQSSFKDNGIPVAKYCNKNKDGSLPPSKEAYVDFPLLRLGEVYLNYAEAVLRNGQGGDKATAIGYVNDLRKRAYSDEAKAVIGEQDFNLDFILDERGRELFYEAQRRTDLIRFGKFTTSAYLWPWKGGIAEGKAVGDHLNIYPLPSDEIGSNTNLNQNTGYQTNLK
ncbi:MAG: RagB/SusD family nutrient uptake outer membrane protein [Mediterranea sp.]|jgi:hypothetical protein|nr:RagB/SusD family nutrient uptake outer membrane protein [Mediterranea sp.]